jgi:hypothetical protein
MERPRSSVMPGLGPGIHAFARRRVKIISGEKEKVRRGCPSQARA